MQKVCGNCGKDWKKAFSTAGESPVCSLTADTAKERKRENITQLTAIITSKSAPPSQNQNFNTRSEESPAPIAGAFILFM